MNKDQSQIVIWFDFKRRCAYKPNELITQKKNDQRIPYLCQINKGKPFNGRLK
jgi:hypothetical protein